MKKAFDKLEETFSNLERSINDKKFLETRYPAKKYDVSLVKHTIKTQQQKVNQLLTALSKRNQRIMQLANDNEQLLTHIKGKMDQLSNLDVHSVKQKYIENNNEKKSIEDGCAASFETIVKVLDDMNKLVRLRNVSHSLNHNHQRSDYTDKENIANMRNSILKSDEYNKTIQSNTWCKDITNINTYADEVTTSPNRELSPQSSLDSFSETSENQILIRYPLSENIKNNGNLEKNNSLVRVNDNCEDGGLQLYFSPKQHENNDLCPYFYKFDDEIQKLKTKVEYLQNTFESSINKIGDNEEELTNELYREIDVDNEKENYKRHSKKCIRGKYRHFYKKEKSLTTSEDECSSNDSFFTDVSSVEIRENEKFNNAFRKSDNYNRNNGFRVKENNMVKNISVEKEKRCKDFINNDQKNKIDTDQDDKIQEFIDSTEKDCGEIDSLIKGGTEKKKSDIDSSNKPSPTTNKEDIKPNKVNTNENEDNDGKATPKRKKEKRLRLTKKSGKKIKLKGRLFVTSRTSSDFSCIQALDSQDENTPPKKGENKKESSYISEKISTSEGVTSDKVNEGVCQNETKFDGIQPFDSQDEYNTSKIEENKKELNGTREKESHFEGVFTSNSNKDIFQNQTNVDGRKSIDSQDENTISKVEKNEKESNDAKSTTKDDTSKKDNEDTCQKEENHGKYEANAAKNESSKVEGSEKASIDTTESNEEKLSDIGEDKSHQDKNSSGSSKSTNDGSQNGENVKGNELLNLQDENTISEVKENEKDVKGNVIRLKGGTSSDGVEKVCQNEANIDDKKSLDSQDENTTSITEGNEKESSDFQENVSHLEGDTEDNKDDCRNEVIYEGDKFLDSQDESTNSLIEVNEKKSSEVKSNIFYLESSDTKDSRDNICYLEDSFSGEDEEEINQGDPKSLKLNYHHDILKSNEKDFVIPESIVYQDVDVTKTENFEDMKSSDIENDIINIDSKISTENSMESIDLRDKDKSLDDKDKLVPHDFTSDEEPIEEADRTKNFMEEDIILPIEEKEVLCSNETTDLVDTLSIENIIDGDQFTENEEEFKEKTFEIDKDINSCEMTKKANALSPDEELLFTEENNIENFVENKKIDELKEKENKDEERGPAEQEGTEHDTYENENNDESEQMENKDRIYPEDQEKSIGNDKINETEGSSFNDETCHTETIISGDENRDEGIDCEDIKKQNGDIPADILEDIQVKEWYDSERSSEEEYDEVEGKPAMNEDQNSTLSNEDSKEGEDDGTPTDSDIISEKSQKDSEDMELKEKQSFLKNEDEKDDIKSFKDLNTTTNESKPDCEDEEILEKQFPSIKDDKSNQESVLIEENSDISEEKAADKRNGNTSDNENNDKSTSRRTNVYKRSFSEICIYHENNNNMINENNENICSDLESDTNVQNSDISDEENNSKQNRKSITSTPTEEKIYLKNVKKLRIDPSVTSQKTIYLQDLTVEKCQVNEIKNNRNDSEASFLSSNKSQMDDLSDINEFDSNHEKNLIDTMLDNKDEYESSISSGNNFDSAKIMKELKDSDVENSLTSNKSDNSYTTDIHTYELLKTSSSINSLGHDYVNIEHEKKKSTEEQLQNEVKIERKPFRRAERGKYEQSMLHKKSKPNERCPSCDKLSYSNSFQEHNISLSESSITSSTSLSSDDVIIVHDSMFKFISNSTVKDKELKIKKLWSPTLQDAYEAISQEQLYPKVVLLHTGATDVCRYSVEDMVDRVVRIYKYVSERGIKFIFSEIPPRVGQPEFNEKARLFNTLVAKQLASARDVTICNNHNGEQSSNGVANNVHTINLIENR